MGLKAIFDGLWQQRVRIALVFFAAITMQLVSAKIFYNELNRIQATILGISDPLLNLITEPSLVLVNAYLGEPPDSLETKLRSELSLTKFARRLSDPKEFAEFNRTSVARKIGFDGGADLLSSETGARNFLKFLTISEDVSFPRLTVTLDADSKSADSSIYLVEYLRWISDKMLEAAAADLRMMIERELILRTFDIERRRIVSNSLLAQRVETLKAVYKALTDDEFDNSSAGLIERTSKQSPKRIDAAAEISWLQAEILSLSAQQGSANSAREIVEALYDKELLAKVAVKDLAFLRHRVELSSTKRITFFDDWKGVSLIAIVSVLIAFLVGMLLTISADWRKYKS